MLLFVSALIALSALVVAVAAAALALVPVDSTLPVAAPSRLRSVKETRLGGKRQAITNQQGNTSKQI